MSRCGVSLDKRRMEGVGDGQREERSQNWQTLKGSEVVRAHLASGSWASSLGGGDGGAAPGWGDSCWICGTEAAVRYLEAKLAKSEAGGVRR